MRVRVNGYHGKYIQKTFSNSVRSGLLEPRQQKGSIMKTVMVSSACFLINYHSCVCFLINLHYYACFLETTIFMLVTHHFYACFLRTTILIVVFTNKRSQAKVSTVYLAYW